MTSQPTLNLDRLAILRRYRAVLKARAQDELYDKLADSVADVPPLLAEIGRVWSDLLTLRLRYANLRAAAHATLSAHLDGEPDPLAYLVDELLGEWPTEPPSTRDSR